MGAVICESPHVMRLLAIVLGHIIGVTIGTWIVYCLRSRWNDE